MKQSDEYADYYFFLWFLYWHIDPKRRDISVRKHSHIDIKQNTKSLRSDNDCNTG